jgi:putative ABC transport system permease protein
MTFWETTTIALHAVVLNKVRSFLTMLGVIIGVGAVILLMAIGAGLQDYITGQFNQLGSNVLIVMPGDLFSSGGGGLSQGGASALTTNKLEYSDVLKIQRLRPLVTSAVPIQVNSANASFQNNKKKVPVVGTTDQYAATQFTPLSEGRFFTADEMTKGERVAVVGPQTVTALFGNTDPISKTINIESQNFRVIGVAKAGGGLGGSHDTYIYIPTVTYRSLFDSQVITEIIVKTQDVASIPDATIQIKKVMMTHMKSDEFSVVETTQILSTINQILGVLTLGLGGIAAISLLVGGIGIMNIMLVSVTERTREIGLRKAIGATPHQILLQFLIESSVISVMGGMIGVGIAFLGTLAIHAVFPAVITPLAVALAFGVSVLIGVVFGVAPARRASLLSPIEALRYE